MSEYFHAFTPHEDAREPRDVKIQSLSAKSLEDQQKIRVSIKLIPFKQLPDLSFKIFDTQNTEVSAVSMIESVLNELDFVMHIRRAKEFVQGNYTLHASVIYREFGEVDQKTISFEV